MKINDFEFAEKYSQIQKLYQKLNQSKCQKCPKFLEQYSNTDKKQRLRNQINKLQFDLSEESLYLMPEFNFRLDVLLKLNYIDVHKTVQLKGRVAREVRFLSYYFYFINFYFIKFILLLFYYFSYLLFRIFYLFIFYFYFFYY